MDLEKFLNTKLHRKVLAFFYEYPSCVETPQGIAHWTGSAVEKIEKIIKVLFRHKIIIKHKGFSTECFAFTHDQKLIKEVETFFKNSSE